MRYPGLKYVKDPELRKRIRQTLVDQDRHLCYFLSAHEEPCWAEHRPLPYRALRAGNFCNGRYVKTPYYGDEHWKIRYWRKAITG